MSAVSIIGSLVTQSGVNVSGNAAIGGTLTVGGNINVNGNINAQVIALQPSNWSTFPATSAVNLAGYPLGDATTGAVTLSSDALNLNGALLQDLSRGFITIDANISGGGLGLDLNGTLLTSLTGNVRMGTGLDMLSHPITDSSTGIVSVSGQLSLGGNDILNVGNIACTTLTVSEGPASFRNNGGTSVRVDISAGNGLTFYAPSLLGGAGFSLNTGTGEFTTTTSGTVASFVNTSGIYVFPEGIDLAGCNISNVNTLSCTRLSVSQGFATFRNAGTSNVRIDITSGNGLTFFSPSLTGGVGFSLNTGTGEFTTSTSGTIATIVDTSGNVKFPERVSVGTSTLSGSVALTVSGDIYCSGSVFTSSSSVYVGSAKISQSGNNLAFTNVSNLELNGTPFSAGWSGTATSDLNMSGYGISNAVSLGVTNTASFASTIGLIVDSCSVPSIPNTMGIRLYGDYDESQGVYYPGYGPSTVQHREEAILAPRALTLGLNSSAGNWRIRTGSARLGFVCSDAATGAFPPPGGNMQGVYLTASYGVVAPGAAGLGISSISDLCSNAALTVSGNIVSSRFNGYSVASNIPYLTVSSATVSLGYTTNAVRMGPWQILTGTALTSPGGGPTSLYFYNDSNAPTTWNFKDTSYTVSVIGEGGNTAAAFDGAVTNSSISYCTIYATNQVNVQFTAQGLWC